MTHTSLSVGRPLIAKGEQSACLPPKAWDLTLRDRLEKKRIADLVGWKIGIFVQHNILEGVQTNHPQLALWIKAHPLRAFDLQRQNSVMPHDTIHVIGLVQKDLRLTNVLGLWHVIWRRFRSHLSKRECDEV